MGTKLRDMRPYEAFQMAWPQPEDDVEDEILKNMMNEMDSRITWKDEVTSLHHSHSQRGDFVGLAVAMNSCAQFCGVGRDTLLPR